MPHGRTVLVSAVGQQTIADFMDHPELRAIADEAMELDRALVSLGLRPPPHGTPTA